MEKIKITKVKLQIILHDFCDEYLTSALDMGDEIEEFVEKVFEEEEENI